MAFVEVRDIFMSRFGVLMVVCKSCCIMNVEKSQENPTGVLCGLWKCLLCELKAFENAELC